MVGGATLERGAGSEEAVDYREPVIVSVTREPSASAVEEHVEQAEEGAAEFIAESPFEKMSALNKEADNVLFRLSSAAVERIGMAMKTVRELPRAYESYKEKADMHLFIGTLNLPETDIELEKTLVKGRLEDRQWRLENGWIDENHMATARKEIEILKAKLEHANAVEQERLAIRPKIAEAIRNYDGA